METDNNSSADSFEHVETDDTGMDGQEVKRMDNGIEILRSEFRAEIDAIKSENKVLLAKLDSFLAQNGELKANNRDLQTRLESIEQELKVIKLEEKKKMVVELGKLGMQMDQEMANLDGKLEALESQASDGQQIKLHEEFSLNLVTSLERNEDGTRKRMMLELLSSKVPEFLWSPNRWQNISSRVVRVSADGLLATAMSGCAKICAQQPISLDFLISLNIINSFYYYEVLLKNLRPSAIGWVDPIRSVIMDQNSVYGIDSSGNYWESDEKYRGHADGFICSDIVGSGLLLTQKGQLKLFFTLNGRMNGKPIVLNVGQRDLLFPTIRFLNEHTSVEANFGADPAKPFKFDINAHMAKLFD